MFGTLNISRKCSVACNVDLHFIDGFYFCETGAIHFNGFLYHLFSGKVVQDNVWSCSELIWYSIWLKSIYFSFQICLMLFVNHLSIIIGFIISPCRLGSIEDETSFEIVCITLSTIRLFTIISSFSWKVLEHVYIQFRVAKVRVNNFWLICIRLCSA